MKKPIISSFSAHTPEDVSMPEAARPIQRKKPSQKSKDSTERPNGATERSPRSVDDNKERSVLEEMTQVVTNKDKRTTERYSFEIYADQKDRIYDLQYQYKKRTGNKLSNSRIIREAIDLYLDEVLNE